MSVVIITIFFARLCELLIKSSVSHSGAGVTKGAHGLYQVGNQVPYSGVRSGIP